MHPAVQQVVCFSTQSAQTRCSWCWTSKFGSLCNSVREKSASVDEGFEKVNRWLSVLASLYERRSKTNLYFFRKQISKTDFECALTAVAKGSRRSCERSAEAKLVTWAPCNNWASDFRLLFPAREKANWTWKKQFGSQFALSQAWKKGNCFRLAG